MATYPLQAFKLNKLTGTILIQRHQLTQELQPGFPATISITSHHSGKTVNFVQDNLAARANDYWDGEEMHYIPEEPTKTRWRVVVYYGGDSE